MINSQEFQIKKDNPRQFRNFARSRIRRINSLDQIPEDQENTENTVGNCELLENGKQLHIKSRRQQSTAIGIRKILWFWPNFLVNLIFTLLRYIFYIPLSIAAPSFWLSALLWGFWKLTRVPVSFFKWLTQLDSNSSEQITGPAAKRTILISSGSCIQTLHLARNLYSSGARVIVFEFEGYFGLARFSTAVDKFYVVPKPTRYNVDSYIAALCHIVKKENPTVFIPVCATSSAYFDALAKPHLELLGCASFIPGLPETIILDDCLQLYQKCAAQNIPLPPHKILSSLSDLYHWYDHESGFISNYRNTLMAVGMQGILDRYKYVLPNNKADLKFNHEISERQQWILVRDLPGQEDFITCTTVKDSRVVANVACKVDQDTKNLIPVVANDSTNVAANSDDANKIDIWLKNFFTKIRFQRPINGHISFRLIKCPTTGNFMPLSVRTGVSIPYIIYNRYNRSSHAQVLCRTIKCIHMKPLSLVSSSSDDETEASGSGSSWRWPSINTESNPAALDKRFALFAYFDPLPYCAYYHFQLPIQSVKMFLQKRNRNRTKNLPPRISKPVH